MFPTSKIVMTGQNFLTGVFSSSSGSGEPDVSFEWETFLYMAHSS